MALVDTGRRTCQHDQLKQQALSRLETQSTSFFCKTVTAATLPVRPSGLILERGSLSELDSVLLCTFARHFIGIQPVDSQVTEDIIEHFGVHILQETWSL
jgi:hypothetical protein